MGRMFWLHISWNARHAWTSSIFVSDLSLSFYLLQYKFNHFCIFTLSLTCPKGKIFPFSVLNIITQEILTGNGIVYTGIISLQITLNR
jgi:hypothetical protein